MPELGKMVTTAQQPKAFQALTWSETPNSTNSEPTFLDTQFTKRLPTRELHISNPFKDRLWVFLACVLILF